MFISYRASATCTPPGTVTALASTNVGCSFFTANWNTPTGTATDYLLDLSTHSDFSISEPGYPLAIGSTGNLYSITGLSASAVYYYRIKAVNGTGCFSSAWSNSIVVVTQPNSATCECTPVNDLTCATDYISNISISTLNNSSGCSTGGYSYYPQTTILAIDSSYNLNMSTGGSNVATFGAGVWFDFNHNISLLDGGEFFLISNVVTTGSTISKSITIPHSATPGFTTMRVRYGIGSVDQSAACIMPNNADGETEDYNVCIYNAINIPSPPQNTLTCVGSVPVFIVGATGSVASYQWYSNTTNTNGGGTIIPGATNATFTPDPSVYNTIGTYYYYCVLGSICGTNIPTPSSSAVSLQVNPIPTVGSISATTTLLCKGNSLSLIGNDAVGVGAPSYIWSGPSGIYTATTSIDTTTFTPTSTAYSGTYSLTVVYPGAGCTSNMVLSPTISVNDSPTVSSIIAPSAPLCTSATLSLCAGATTGSGGISSYFWSGPNGYTATTSTNCTTLIPGTTLASGRYTLSIASPGTGCVSVTDTSGLVTVDTAAAAITGNAAICYLGTTVFSNTTAVGTGAGWSSSNTGVAFINPVSGSVSTAGSGSTDITYNVINSCGSTSSIVTLVVNPLPLSITDNTPVCNGLSICLSDPTSNGVWISGNTAIANINSSTGCITTVASGSATITYILPTGCQTTAIVTVNPLPTTISGTTKVCLGLTTSLSDATAGGTWSSSNGNIIIGSSGSVFGAAEGTAVVTYTLPTSCIITTIVTVNPLPSPIAGTPMVCATQSTSLSDPTSGGTWSSSNSLQAIVGTDGNVIGASAGTPTITYTLPTGCIAIQNVTVNPFSGILGSATVCFGLTTTISDATPGGTWSSNNSNAAIDASTGVITGNAVGTSTITYQIAATGCLTSIIATVNPLPSAITGNAPICSSQTICLTDADGGGAWSSGNTSIATVSGIGCVTGVAVGATSTVAITYTLPTGCTTTTIVTVNPLPLPITGTLGICSGLSTCLSDLTTGGTWSTASGILSVGSAGCVSTTSPGIATIVYTLPTGCTTAVIFTVNPFPGSISGPKVVCSGSTITLSDAGGGTWSSGDATVSVDASSGNITGVAAGPATATITYTLPTSCATSTVITINPLPVAITGISDTVCVGSTIIFSDADGTGTWSSTNVNASIGSSSGIVTGAIAGTTTISYTIATGCAATRTVTVNPLPSAILGTLNVCFGLTTTLSDLSTGGIWTSNNSSIASVGSASGIVTGNTVGSTTITYTLSTGCSISAGVTVNPLPSAIIFLTPNAVCPGFNINLSDATTGGTWGIEDPAIATINVSGVVTGVAGGTTHVTYITVAGCITTTIITINPAPAAISGAANICVGTISSLSDTPIGGTWSSSNGAVATIGSSGIITGNALGTSVISYTLPTGCAASLTVTVVNTVASITGTNHVCFGNTIALTDATTGGTWSSSNITTGTVDAEGIVTGLSAGSTTITYSLSGSCFVVKSITVNPLPGSISGPHTVCVGSSIALSDITAGTWSGSNGLNATVGSATGIITGNLPGVIGCTLTATSTGCIATTVITINPLPSSITGIHTVCSGATVNLSDPDGGGTWSSNNAAIASVGSSTGDVTGHGASAATTTITYTLPTGCTATTVVTVIVTIPAITGTATNCPIFPITLSDAAAGGTWSSGNLAVASVDVTGVVTDVTPGTATISYSLGGICTVTKNVTFNVVPAIIAPPNVCQGTSALLSDPATGGTWSSTNTAVGTIGSTTPNFAALATGTTTISYILPGGCYTITTITVVNTLPSISGTLTVCKGSGTSLSDVTTGGTWSSSVNANVGSSSGFVTGVNAGTATVTYKLGTGCTITAVVTINPLPAIISGSNAMCQFASISLSDATPGGTWSASASLSLTSVATVTTVTATSAGPSTVTYTLPTTGCAAIAAINVNPIPAPIAGPANICFLSGGIETDSSPGGTWSSSNTSVVFVSGGATLGVSVGTANITYQLPLTGCAISKTITVNPLPTSITGTKTICANTTTMLSDAAPGGTWSSNDATIASINPITGILTGISTGTAHITYTTPPGCTIDTIVTILQAPTPIQGTPGVCVGATTTLIDTTASGTWSSSIAAIAPIGSASGIVSGNTIGTTTITYTIPSGCFITTPFTVNAFPAAISGNTNVCPGATTSLSNNTAGGTWSSDNTAIASINGSTGIVTGVAMGSATITYTSPAGCSVMTTVNVFNNVGPVTSAATVVCLGLTLNLNDTTIGGTWSSSSSNITVGSSTGVVGGISLGVATVTYTAPTGCFSTTTLNVLSSLPAITATAFNMCPGAAVTLSNTTTGGAWSSSSANVSVGSATGVVTGIIAGTATITYAIGAGCSATNTVTVNGQPITGPSTICIGTSATLNNVESGGTWSTTSANIFLGSSSGIVTGLAGGVANVTYSSPMGCTVTTVISVVDTLPSIITIPPACVGLTSTLFDAATGGTWSSSNTAIATVSSSGIVTGTGAGTAMITYTLASGCTTRTTITVNPLSSILGTTTLCNETTATLSDATTGGIWSSSNANVTIGSSSGIITAITPGTATINYTLSTGCATSTVVTVNPTAPITGITSICHPGTTTLSNSLTSGAWSSSNAAVGTIGSANGIVTSISLGTTTITYTLPTGCTSSTTVTIVSSLPAITGNTNDCIGAPSLLSDAISGGTWSSNDISTATVNVATGAVTGVAVGSTTITYKLGTGCSVTTLVSINPLPVAISGIVNVCVGLTDVFTDGTTGGTWTSGNTGIASIGSASGIVTGVATGTADVTYTTPAGCIATAVATINPLPAAITGILNICPALTTTLMDLSIGGTWTSSNLSVGTIDMTTGDITSIVAGTSTITYTLPTGCITTSVFNVVNTVSPISGVLKVCTNSTTTLSDVFTGGTWATSNANASVDGTSGVVSGVVAGTTFVTYTLGSGCNVTTTVTINPAPPAIMGASRVCIGSITILSDAISGTWNASNTNASITPSTGLVHGYIAGVDTLTYTIGTGCTTTSVFTIDPLPNPYTVGGGGSYCFSLPGVHILLSGSDTGVSYLLYHGTASTGINASGTGSGIDFGLVTLAGTYTVMATNNTTLCASNMLSTATVNITPAVVPGINISSALGDIICAGTYATFNASIVNGGSTPVYEWRVNGASPGADSNHYSYVPVNGDIVTVKLISNEVCALPDTAVDTFVVNVSENKLPQVSIAIAPGDTLCAGAIATFTAIDSFGGATPYYKWYNNNVLVGTGATFSFTPYLPDNGDIVYCKMASSYACITTDTVLSSYIRLTIDSTAIPIITLSAMPGVTILEGQSDTIIATVEHGGVSPTYEWLMNGHIIPGATTNMFISDTLSNGDSVTCVVRGSGECGLYTYNSAVIITNGKVSVQQVAVGNSDLKLMPNPNNGSFIIRGTLGSVLDEELTVEITDMIGQVIYKSKMMATGGKINEQIKLNGELANGMYSLILHSEHEYKVFHLVIEQ